MGFSADGTDRAIDRFYVLFRWFGNFIQTMDLLKKIFVFREFIGSRTLTRKEYPVDLFSPIAIFDRKARSTISVI